MNLHALLEPASVAIVGASAEPKKLSGMILGFLEKSGYTGRVYAVNPRYSNIGELPCFPSVEALPEVVDLLVCVVPVAVAFEAIEGAARRGVPFCLLMTGGFGEGRTGAEGEARRERLLAICRETGMHVVGPNTVGMVNFRGNLALTFADPKDYEKIDQNDRISVVGLKELAPAKPVQVIIHKANGPDVMIQVNHSMTAQQIAWFKAGSALNALN